MKKKTKKHASKKVAQATRKAVVRTTARLEQLAQKSRQLATAAEKAWRESKPRRQKAEKDLRKAARKAVAFGTEVGKGVKAGLAQARKQK